ncbi:HAD family hydrolase [Marinobacterium weihaiense]|uniref:HAD family hydrolase n=1 Tax=Marinobacterium weihaiense TaxID=2851016 RepID=A0ABS6MA72_9GAMM|nr:HAD-IA family hydrolase [Marinobacterium weihaiense]MBV0933130.1 HAD family hydrolase [Marinobacterium weihaiense]
MKQLRGVIFDLDGTLVSSSLDFPAIKREIGCPVDADVLTFLETLSPQQRHAAQAVIHRHELQDAQGCDWIPGARAFVETCLQQRIPMAIVTRNSHQSSQLKIERNAIPIERVITRENSRPKPDPSALLEVARDFALPPHAVLMVGDYRYDLEAGRNANMKSCLVNYTTLPDYSHLADYAFPNFQSLHAAMFGEPSL